LTDLDGNHNNHFFSSIAKRLLSSILVPNHLSSLRSICGHFTAPHFRTFYSTGSCVFHLSLIVALTRYPSHLLLSVPLFHTPVPGSITHQESSTAATQQVVVLISVHSTQQQSTADTTQSQLRPRSTSSGVVYSDINAAEFTTIFLQTKIHVSQSSAAGIAADVVGDSNTSTQE
jgi:hypothetical protein